MARHSYFEALLNPRTRQRTEAELVYAIAEKYADDSDVQELLDRHRRGCRVVRKRPSFRQSDWHRMVAEYRKQGYSLKEIAKMYRGEKPSRRTTSRKASSRKASSRKASPGMSWREMVAKYSKQGYDLSEISKYYKAGKLPPERKAGSRKASARKAPARKASSRKASKLSWREMVAKYSKQGYDLSEISKYYKAGKLPPERKASSRKAPARKAASRKASSKRSSPSIASWEEYWDIVKNTGISKRKARIDYDRLSAAAQAHTNPHHPLYDQIIGPFGVSEKRTGGYQPVNRR